MRLAGNIIAISVLVMFENFILKIGSKTQTH
jgi:hypothetical protein